MKKKRIQKAYRFYLAAVSEHVLPITTAVVISTLIDWIGVRILAALAIVAIVMSAWKSGIGICLVRSRNSNQEGETECH